MELEAETPLSAAPDHRRRLLEGMAAAIAEHGYAATRLADVVAHARVSRRTFYEHFEDKEECFLALYVALCDHLLEVIADAAAAEARWDERVGAAIRAYLSVLTSQPALSRAALMEIQAAGPRALELRLRVQGRFADQLRELVDLGRTTDLPAMRPLSPRLAAAITGGVNELVLLEFARGDAADFEGLGEEATEFVSSVLGGLLSA
jgi:AcrR family transcriptional regulator